MEFVEKRYLLAVAFLLAATLVLGTGPARAEEMLGVPVFAGATLDPRATEFLQEALGMEGADYRTTADLETVYHFYQGQGGLKKIMKNRRSASFTGPDKLTVNLQIEYTPAADGQRKKATVIQIIRPK